MQKQTKNGYAINIKTGILHTQDCADGISGPSTIESGYKRHYNDYEKATRHPKYKQDHSNDQCLG